MVVMIPAWGRSARKEEIAPFHSWTVLHYGKKKCVFHWDAHLGTNLVTHLTRLAQVEELLHCCDSETRSHLFSGVNVANVDPQLTFLHVQVFIQDTTNTLNGTLWRCRNCVFGIFCSDVLDVDRVFPSCLIDRHAKAKQTFVTW